jgi:hypothetical protein
MDGSSAGATNITSAQLSTEDLLTEAVDARLWYIDSATGHVWTRVTLEGDDPVLDEWEDSGALVPPGAGPGDGADPNDVAGFTCVSIYQQQDDGTSLPVISCTWTLLGAADILGYELEWQPGAFITDPADPGSPPAYDPPDFLNPQSRRVGREQDFAILTPVLGGLTYDARIRGYDAEANVGNWVTYTPIDILPDNDAPEIPEPSAYAGYKMIGIRWDRNAEPDFDHYEVRYRKVGDTDWAFEETRATLIVIANLDVPVDDADPLIDYEAQVRALDASRNVRRPGDPAHVPPIPDGVARPTDADYATIGWSYAVVAAPTKVGQADIVFTNAIIAGIIDAGHINAKWIETGSISVGGSADYPVGIRVYNELGDPIGAWGNFGWVVADPDRSTRAIWATPTGELKFTANYVWDGTEDLDTANPDPDRRDEVLIGIEKGIRDTPAINWTTALSAEGINAQAITFGAVGGGHNKMLNAGFELISFATAAVVNKTWDVTADWASASSQVNLSTGTGDLKMTAV